MQIFSQLKEEAKIFADARRKNDNGRRRLRISLFRTLDGKLTQPNEIYDNCMQYSPRKQIIIKHIGIKLN